MKFHVIIWRSRNSDGGFVTAKYAPRTNLLLPEASVDDAATQVVHPLPLDDVIKDELPACRRSQLTWRPKQKIIMLSFHVGQHVNVHIHASSRKYVTRYFVLSTCLNIP